MNHVRLLFVFLVAACLGAPAFSQDENALKTRMAGRVAAVDAIKVAGLAGENNAGLLEQRGPLSGDQTKVMNEENADRRALYNILASRLNVAAAVVGKERAATIRDKSAAGIWLQAPDGTWYKK